MTDSSDSEQTPRPPRRSYRLARRRQASVIATASSVAPTDPEDGRVLGGVQGGWDGTEHARQGSTDDVHDFVSGAAAPGRSNPVPAFGRYEAASTKSLFDLLHTQMPPPPDYFVSKQGKRFLEQTKSISKTEIEQALGDSDSLSKLVYAPNMFAPLLDLAKSQLKDMEFDPQSIAHLDFAGLVHPWHTTANLPPYVHSEKDTEDWVNATLLRPALMAALAYMKKSMVVPHRDGNAKQPAGDPACWKPKDLFYLSSSDGERHVVPDAIVATDEHIVRGTAEVKTSRALKGRSILLGKKTVNVLEELQKIHTQNGTQHPGRPIKFNWPHDEASASKGKNKKSDEDNPDKQTKILVQIYTQMKMKQCDLAMLSSYETTIFFYLRDSDGVLFFSPEFKYTSNVLLATYCWMCLVIGIISKAEMDLPEVKNWWPSDHWGSSGASTVVGVVPPSLPDYAVHRT